MNKIKLILYFIIIFLVLDVITTLIGLSLGGVELNPILIYLTAITNLSLELIVILTHIIAIIYILLVIKFIKLKESKINLILCSGVLLLYVIVVHLNALQIVIYFVTL